MYREREREGDAMLSRAEVCKEEALAVDDLASESNNKPDMGFGTQSEIHRKRPGFTDPMCVVSVDVQRIRTDMHICSLA